MAYRDDLEAAHARIAALERELADLRRARDEMLGWLAQDSEQAVLRCLSPAEVILMPDGYLRRRTD